MPLVGTSPSADYHRSTIRTRRVGVELRGTHHEFLHRIRRIVLQEATDIVIVVVAAINRKIDVEPGAAAKSNSRDARFAWIGRLDRLSHRRKIGGIGEAPVRQW